VPVLGQTPRLDGELTRKRLEALLRENVDLDLLTATMDLSRA
jgi:hypothetical protein